MTDGIDSFFNKKANRYINDEEKEMVIDRLLKSNQYVTNVIGLAKHCNILQTFYNFEPKDDLSISRLTFINPIDDSIQQTGTED